MKNEFKFDSDLAVEIGLKEAVMVSYLQTKILERKKENKLQTIDRAWLKISRREVAEDIGFFTEKTCRILLERLEEIGVLMVDKSHDKFDQSKIYAFADEKRFLEA